MSNRRYWMQVSIPSVMFIIYVIVVLLVMYAIKNSDDDYWSALAACASASAAWLTYRYSGLLVIVKKIKLVLGR